KFFIYLEDNAEGPLLHLNSMEIRLLLDRKSRFSFCGLEEKVKTLFYCKQWKTSMKRLQQNGKRRMHVQMIRQIDDYFLGNGEGTVVDRLYFYGVYCATLGIAFFTMLSLV